MFQCNVVTGYKYVFNIAGDAKFVSKLDEASKKKAKDEIGEKSDKDRELAVQALRGWVVQQKWLKTPTGNTPTCSH